MDLHSRAEPFAERATEAERRLVPAGRAVLGIGRQIVIAGAIEDALRDIAVDVELRKEAAILG